MLQSRSRFQPLSKYSFEPLGCFVQSQGASMQRRRFLGVLGGAATWPLTARAQQPNRLRRVGILMPFSESDTEVQMRVRAFKQELQRLGWIEGSQVNFDVRWTTDNMDLVRANAASLLELKPDIIVAAGN